MLIPIGAGLPSPATQLFNRPMVGLNREPININNDDAQYKAFKARQNKDIKGSDTNTHFPIP